MALSCHSMESPVQAIDDTALVAAARRALSIETRALEALQPRIGAAFAAACRLCLDCGGRVIVTGIGKSGHVGRKIPAIAGEHRHPRLLSASAGSVRSHRRYRAIVTRHDLLLALSNSGETPVILMLLPHLARLGVLLVALTGNPESCTGAHRHGSPGCQRARGGLPAEPRADGEHDGDARDG